MKIASCWLLGCGTLFIFLACGCDGQTPHAQQSRHMRPANHNGPVETSASEDMVLPAQEVVRLRGLAATGNAEAEFQLAVHYLFSDERNTSLATYYYTRAATRGHGRAMYNLAALLYESGGRDNCEMAEKLFRASRETSLEQMDANSVDSWLQDVAEDARCK